MRTDDPPLPDPVERPTEELIVLLSRVDVRGAELDWVVLAAGAKDPPPEADIVAPCPPPDTVSLTLPCDDELSPGTSATLGDPTVDA